MQRDPWTVLGVQPDAAPEEVRRAFRRRARELHPDRRPDDPRAEEEFKVLVEALLAATSGGPRRRGKGRADDGADRAGSRGHRSFPDVVADFDVSLAEALHGGSQTARLRFDLPCRCRPATGRPRRSCPLCAGRGAIRVERRVTFHVPAGSREGDLIRVAGDGGKEAQCGDLRVRLRVRPPPGAWVEGNDLHLTLPLTIPEAIGGARVPVPAPGGTVTVTVPPGTDGTTVLRVLGHGLPPRPGSNAARGHLFLHPTVVVPKNPAAQHLRAAATLAAAYPHDPRAGWTLETTPGAPSGRCT
ncbi:MAG: J domain-containing protein [Myxococcales bacterium]|nr:J domain-containing protein [Myxococcales bacterium]